jgi:hypothetical protein
VRSHRTDWRQIAALVAVFALALNATIGGAFGHCPRPQLDAWGQPICGHHAADRSATHRQQPAGQHDNDGLCCKCCGVIALNATAAPPSPPLPTPVEWRQPLPMAVSLFRPYTPRHFIEPARGPPIA